MSGINPPEHSQELSPETEIRIPPKFFRSSYYTSELLEQRLEEIRIRFQATDKSEAIRTMIMLFSSTDVETVIQLKKRAYNSKKSA